ncbi:hypothetical protein BX616_003333 [Lobosporangium transversale]|nr:hypothetical protein BX616_003333 [Lobosporangium transversale]
MTIATNLCILHFSIPDRVYSTASTQDSPSIGTVAKNGTHEWTCQLSILEDKSTVRASLAPLTHSEAKRTEFQHCCSLQVAAPDELHPDPRHVLLSLRIKSDDIFKGIEFHLERKDVWLDQNYEFYIILSSFPLKLLGPHNAGHWTHSLASSEFDPIARNIDPLVEMMTQFENHTSTSDVEFRFISKAGLVLDRKRAHHAVLSIYPSLSAKLTLAQHNPHQRPATTVLTAPISTWAVFEKLIGFIYSGRLPSDGYVPRSDQWRVTFDLGKEYGLNKCPSSTPWVEWHLNELQQVITDENVLEVYFGWGFEHPPVTQMCVHHVVERSQVRFQGLDLGSHVMRLLKSQYRGWRGCYEFEEALVVLTMKMYADQQQHQKHDSYLKQLMA